MTSRRGTTRKHRWNALVMGHRIPEVELNRKLTTIHQHYSQFKREKQVAEGRAWNSLFENDQVSCQYHQLSVTKHCKQDQVG